MNILTMRHVVHAILIRALRKRINKAFRFIFRILGSLNCLVHICILLLLLKNCSFFVEMNAFKTLQKSSSYSKQFRDNFLQLAFSFFLFFVSRCLYSRQLISSAIFFIPSRLGPSFSLLDPLDAEPRAWLRNRPGGRKGGKKGRGRRARVPSLHRSTSLLCCRGPRARRKGGKGRERKRKRERKREEKGSEGEKREEKKQPLRHNTPRREKKASRKSPLVF